MDRFDVVVAIPTQALYSEVNRMIDVARKNGFAGHPVIVRKEGVRGAVHYRVIVERKEV